MPVNLLPTALSIKVLCVNRPINVLSLHSLKILEYATAVSSVQINMLSPIVPPYKPILLSLQKVLLASFIYVISFSVAIEEKV